MKVVKVRVNSDGTGVDIANVKMRARPDAVIAVGVDERTVDGLIDAVQGTPLEPARWLVFGSNMRLLGLVEGHWRDVTEITVGHVPHLNGGIRDAVQAIVDLEGLRPGDCVWLDGGSPCDLPRGFRLSLCAGGLSVRDLADALGGYCSTA